MYKKFEGALFGVGSSANRSYLLHGEFPRQHNLRQPYILQKTRFVRCANIGLGAGVQLDRG